MVATLVTEGAQTAHKVSIPPAGYAILALAGFAILLLVTFAFRSVGNRH